MAGSIHSTNSISCTGSAHSCLLMYLIALGTTGCMVRGAQGKFAVSNSKNVSRTQEKRKLIDQCCCTNTDLPPPVPQKNLFVSRGICICGAKMRTRDCHFPSQRQLSLGDIIQPQKDIAFVRSDPVVCLRPACRDLVAPDPRSHRRLGF